MELWMDIPLIYIYIYKEPKTDEVKKKKNFEEKKKKEKE